MSPTTPVHSSSTRLKADLILLLVAMIWGSAFAAQRVAAMHMGTYLFNGVRFLLGALVLLPLALRRPPANPFGRHTPQESSNTLPGMLLAGLLLFGGTSLQQLGLEYTTAGNAGFITGLYVVLVPLILAVGWRRPPRPLVWVASCMAAIGLFLLSTGGSFSLAIGDALVLAGAFLWAFHVLLIGWLAQRAHILRLAVVQYAVCGALSLAVSLLLETNHFAGLSSAWWTVIYTGVLSIGLGYTLQAVGQRVAPPADAAILLSLEAVFAALAGWLILNERLSAVQLLGCGLMLGGMLLAQTPIAFASKNTR